MKRDLLKTVIENNQFEYNEDDDCIFITSAAGYSLLICDDASGEFTVYLENDEEEEISAWNITQESTSKDLYDLVRTTNNKTRLAYEEDKISAALKTFLE